jgi:hydroxyacylglutathione hydrolase
MPVPQLEIVPIPAFADNYIWMLRLGRRAAVVDPGDAQPVLERLDREGLELAAIVVTHHHADHVGGVEALLGRGAVPVFGPAGERIPGRSRALREGDVAELPGLEIAFAVLDVPGHTAGHIAYVGAGALFCGDTLFAAGCGRLFEGTPAQMSASLAKLAALPPETRVYCAHEYTLSNLRFAVAVEPRNPALGARLARDETARREDRPTLPSTMGVELETNPFLRCAQPEVVSSASRHAGRALSDPVEVFAEIRSWKNVFR